MEKIKLYENIIIKLAKKHKKLFEHYFIKRYAYIVDGDPFYLASYKRKNKTTGYSILSPISNNKTRSDQMRALVPLLHYTVSIRNITTDVKYRANVEFTILYEVRDYLHNVIQSNVLDNKDEEVYIRSLSIIRTMLELQEELKERYKEVLNKYDYIKEIGFITDNDVEEIKKYLLIFMQIQYKQFRDRYDYRSDFDVIYKNRNDQNIKSFDNFRDPNTLFEMTSKQSEKDLREALEKASFGKDLSGTTEEERDQLGIEHFQKELDNLLEYVKNNLRNP